MGTNILYSTNLQLQHTSSVATLLLWKRTTIYTRLLAVSADKPQQKF